MRAIGALLLVGCAQQSGHPAADAAFDADPSACMSAAGTANVVVRTVGPAKVYDRLFAGGVELGGPVNGATGIPFELKLVFANESPMSPATGACCAIQDPSCCGIDTLAVTVQTLASGGEVGNHTATVAGASFMTTGTLTITSWMQPLDMPPGRVAGSLTVTTNTITIDGTFDNAFCAGMVGVTI